MNRKSLVATVMMVASTIASATDTHITVLEWSDGDSGKANGVPFRLANVDAPETGGVGTKTGAKCEEERKLGYASKAFILGYTQNADVHLGAIYGRDSWGRIVVDLIVDSEDLGTIGKESGHLKAWPFKGRKRLADKPAWCSI